MEIWFPDHYTEAHRSPERKRDLVEALTDSGIECSETLDSDCELVFCGSIYTFRNVVEKGTKLPVVHYNWDMYPCMVENDKNADWKGYIGELKTCARILVPNIGTAIRTEQYTGSDSHVVPASVKVWEIPDRREEFGDLSKSGSYVLDVMRDYPWDDNQKLSERICKRLKIPLVKSGTGLPWEQFKYQVGNSAILLSCYREASTGGLTLLEGYAHGIPVLLSDSKLNGAGEYFGERASYFDSHSIRDAEERLWELWKDYSNRDGEFYRNRGGGNGNREWVETEFSDRKFAANLKKEFEKCLESK